MINSRAMPVPLTSSYQRVAGTVPQHTPSRDFADPLGVPLTRASFERSHAAGRGPPSN
jgi:hypothetical protein